MTDPILSLRGLSFAYPGRPVLDELSADFGPGVEWIRGRNGTGKSTLLKLIAGGLSPSAGSLWLAGTSLRDARWRYQQQLFWCGPGELPLSTLSTAQYLGFIAGLYPRFDEQAAIAHLQAFSLDQGAALGTLSTGSLRKVWLTAALAANTRLVLLDEPFLGLDEGSAAYLRERLGRAAGDRCWLIASHVRPLEDGPLREFQLG